MTKFECDCERRILTSPLEISHFYYHYDKDNDKILYGEDPEFNSNTYSDFDNFPENLGGLPETRIPTTSSKFSKISDHCDSNHRCQTDQFCFASISRQAEIISESQYFHQIYLDFGCLHTNHKNLVCHLDNHAFDLDPAGQQDLGSSYHMLCCNPRREGDHCNGYLKPFLKKLSEVEKNHPNLETNLTSLGNFLEDSDLEYTSYEDYLAFKNSKIGEIHQNINQTNRTKFYQNVLVVGLVSVLIILIIYGILLCQKNRQKLKKVEESLEMNSHSETRLLNLEASKIENSFVSSIPRTLNTTLTATSLREEKYNPPTISKQVTLQEIIGQGKYGKVYKGIFNNSLVAVKIFLTRDEDSWKRETDLYNTINLRHNYRKFFIF